MLERWNGLFGMRGGIFVALGLALAVPNVGCKKKAEDSDKDEKASKKKGDDDETEKDSKKKKKKSSDDDDDSDKKKKKKATDDEADDSDKKKKKSDDDGDDDKSAKKAKAPKSVDDDGDDDDDEPIKKKSKGLKPNKGDVDIVGTWSVAGKNDGGKKYKGTSKIAKIGGSMFKATWTIGGEKQEGIIFKDGNVLSCGWSPKKDLGVVAYLVKPGMLDGVWFEEQHTTLGNEILKGPASKDTLSGLYTITKGETPGDKKKYSGSVNITIYKSGVYGLSWKMGGQSMKGLGLRSNHFEGSDTDVLSAGFNDGGDAGVMQYIIYGDGKTMKGHWALPPKGSGDPGWGTETMVKDD